MSTQGRHRAGGGPRWSRRRVLLVLLVAAVVIAIVAVVIGTAVVGTANGARPEAEPPQATGMAEVRGAPGALPVGTADYPVPEGAIVVSPSGSDEADGTLENPLASLGAAISRASTGATIVLRAGEYRGSFIIPRGIALTVQPYPGEAVWLEGSREVQHWQPDGDAWFAPGWDVRFDASPTYTRGAPDGTTAGWQFVDPEFPMAAHPDQVWVDGEALAQVATRAELRSGAFYVDEAEQRLYLGSDPAGQDVRASETAKALVIAGEGSVVRGIGIRRYAPSVPDIGAVAIAAADVTLENLAITDSATTGLAVFASDATLTHLTITGSGMLGAQASTADRLAASDLLIADNNTERFNRAPVAGGFKIHKSRGVSITSSAFLSNAGNGLWLDESVYDMELVGNDIIDSAGNGLVVELSSKAVIADNVILRSARDGILISDSGHIEVWNNTVAGSFRSLNIVQGTRRASDVSLPGHDPRRPLPDPTVTWVTEHVNVSNNVFADATGTCVLCVEDHSHERSAAQMNVRSNGNIFHRTSATTPEWVVVWSRGTGHPAVYTSIAAFSRDTGQDAVSIAIDGTPALQGTALSPSARLRAEAVAQPLDPALAAVVDQPVGTRHLGAWER